MRRLALFTVLCAVFLTSQADVELTPSDVYSQALLIEQETALIKNNLHVTKPAMPIPSAEKLLMPRHVWQKSYMLQMKIFAFRLKHGLGALSPVQIEPSKNIRPRYVWEQTQRTLSEIHIIRKLLGINGNVSPPPTVENKTPTDVYNKLNQIEAEWDVLADTNIDASYSFAQIMRLNEDLNMIFTRLNLFDNAIPPAKEPNSIPRDALQSAFAVLAQIQRLQKLARIETADLSDFYRTDDKIVPSDVFNVIGLLLAEMQTLKAELGISETTIAAKNYTGKTPADTRQLLGYIENKFLLISHL